MKEGIFALALILFAVFLPRIFGVLSQKGYNAVQKKMDQRAQRKEDDEQNS